jgi:hypothetical protein
LRARQLPRTSEFFLKSQFPQALIENCKLNSKKAIYVSDCGFLFILQKQFIWKLQYNEIEEQLSNHEKYCSGISGQKG